MHAINVKFGFSSIKLSEYEGILLETLVGSNLVNLKNSEQFFEFSIFYESYNVKKQRVDFIIKKDFDEVIPIEVGHGNKDDNQIKDAIIFKYNTIYEIKWKINNISQSKYFSH